MSPKKTEPNTDNTSEPQPDPKKPTTPERVCVRTPDGQAHCGELVTREDSGGLERTSEDKDR